MRTQTFMLIPLLALGACSEKAPDPRGVEHDETLLSVSATGRSETRPDEARFTAGVSTIAASAEDATRRNNETMTKVTEALKAFGVAGKDLQTRQLTVNRIEWGANKGKFEAVNQVEVRMRAVDKAGEAVAATTEAGANVLSGPTLRVSDQEAATKSAYAAAYRAAR
ncbi:MAG TPA: SIMPL domain-containing protein, partial [Sphingopyxis sp.]|nr:SIMPL domain-containing protein [Sphingopyxis sp.]